MHKYVEFVSDEDFLECVRKVVDSYQTLDENITPTSILTESKNTIDEFKTIFDVCVNQISFDEWSKIELTRQQDKTINNKIGEFHQELLGKVNGWVDLGVGDETEIDLKKEDNTVFIELKNKYNTMNSSSEKTCREKLEKVIEKYPDATAYWAYVISKNYKSECRVWKYQQREDERIKRISGDRLYAMITGDSQALEKTFDAIPKAIVEILSEDYRLSKDDEKLKMEYNNIIFKNEDD
ncbi:Eco47II family restriction endonuclease [Methanobrevibacter millerae]|uniref:Eco47II restriction endonuclease n=1 Tax=Methanobrevibacter millerae TaxID=230361 RepID=A0A0U3E9W0_9EURY|nr:Eco47II family restriction endonuclease [Methanobrevibacter millerae]ALT68257.1 Eco47II restriction endonuclease [Methanobrevibacter millerae]